MSTRRSLLMGAAAAAGLPNRRARRTGAVLTGIDVLAAESFARLKGLRVGLISNQSGRDRWGRRTADLLGAARGVRLSALFSPEHGWKGEGEGAIGSDVDAGTGLPVRSLYGATLRPTNGMLEGLDALVVDLQDVGVRFFTYATTMAYAMEAAARLGLAMFVLDRPNPIGPAGARGPVLDPSLRGFTAYFPEPVQHGMTLGELALMFNAENRIAAKLAVVPMRGYRRSLWFDETGLAWIDPSPNLRSFEAVMLYPGVGLIEGANVSVGRGAPRPFEVVGAPWISAFDLFGVLERRAIPGVRFEPARFRPDQDRYAGVLCEGVRIRVTDRSVLDGSRLGVELASALWRLHPERFEIGAIAGSLGSPKTLAEIVSNASVAAITAAWQGQLGAFEVMRSKYLLYP